MRQYICIDLKSFYASVECVERGLDPMRTNLVVADSSRTEKTICLAVSPALKAYGIPGRARLFEVVQKVRDVNRIRTGALNGERLSGESYDAIELKSNPSLALGYIVAPPRMAHYMKFSTEIYNIYLKYIAPEDIHVYSIDEVFIDATNYLATYAMTARELAMKIIKDVLSTTGITATAGIGTNMYLAKIAMDIMAKRVEADSDGVRIAELDEMSYRKNLWSYKPITDFWRVGAGYSKRLSAAGLFTMGDVARCSVHNEELLYKMFGVNAELLIDHAWGWEPCTIAQVKQYRPQSSSMGTGQVLHCPYNFEKARLIVREMTELLVLDLVDKGLVTKQMVLTVGYDIENLKDENTKYQGEIKIDRYGRKIPKHAHGTINLPENTSSTRLIMRSVMELYDRIVDKELSIRRINLAANDVVSEIEANGRREYKQFDLFYDNEEELKQQERLKKERSIQKTIIKLKKQFGKNAVIKGMNLQEGATTIDRNRQIGGHKA